MMAEFTCNTDSSKLGFTSSSSIFSVFTIGTIYMIGIQHVFIWINIVIFGSYSLCIGMKTLFISIYSVKIRSYSFFLRINIVFITIYSIIFIAMNTLFISIYSVRIGSYSLFIRINTLFRCIYSVTSGMGLSFTVTSVSLTLTFLLNTSELSLFSVFWSDDKFSISLNIFLDIFAFLIFLDNLLAFFFSCTDLCSTSEHVNDLDFCMYVLGSEIHWHCCC